MSNHAEPRPPGAPRWPARASDAIVHAERPPGHDYIHDHDALTPLADNALWHQDNVFLRSVGIDIGSSGTQVMFSRIHLRRLGEDLTSRYVVVERIPLYQSPVRFTPYRHGHQIDAEGLGSIIDDAYAEAAESPDSVDTGVVIITGEAARRRNAERITEIVSTRAGDFVCATAGHHMEAMLAAHGSGAVRTSYEAGSRILNVDMGGATTKLAAIQDGRVLATAALDIGGRLLVVDEHGRLVRQEPAGRRHAAGAGFRWSLGDAVADGDLDRVAETMADSLVAALTEPRNGGAKWLYVTEPIEDIGDVDGVMFSGGVAEFVYGREARDFGDLGRRLGAAVRSRIDNGSFPFDLLPAGECIRATVLGASEYTVQLSGNTTYISDPDILLPRRNVQVLRPDYVPGDVIDPAALASAIRDRFTDFDADGVADVALALSWAGVPSHDRLLAFARGIRGGIAARLANGRPGYLVLDGDVALSLGSVLRDELGVTGGLLVIDGLSLWDFDYVDLGRIRLPSNTVPVTIKSLLFGDETRIGRADGSREGGGR